LGFAHGFPALPQRLLGLPMARVSNGSLVKRLRLGAPPCRVFPSYRFSPFVFLL
jgi:hypothetical protein